MSDSVAPGGRPFRFVTVDVFADRRFGGNPLAVFPEAEGLSGEEMQAIAAEFNLAETAFVLPPRAPENTAHVRIFTPRAEMPFAGHPNVGTAYVLAREAAAAGRPLGRTLRFEEIAGLVDIESLEEAGRPVGARLRAPQPLTLGDTISPEIISKACSVPIADIIVSRHAPRIASCGAPLVFAELASLAALAGARPIEQVFAEGLPQERVVGAYLYVRTPGGETDVQSRMFAPLHGIVEDPATGAAAVAIAGLTAAIDPAPELRLSLRIGQGFDMGRRSLLDVIARKENGRVIDTFVGGLCVPVMRGVVDLA